MVPLIITQNCSSNVENANEQLFKYFYIIRGRIKTSRYSNWRLELGNIFTTKIGTILTGRLLL